VPVLRETRGLHKSKRATTLALESGLPACPTGSAHETTQIGTCNGSKQKWNWQMTPKWTIRPVTAEDQADWRALWTKYLEFYESTVPETVYEQSFARLLSGDPNEYHGFIARLDGKAVGLTHYLFHRDMWSVANTCYLQDLYVDPAQRGTGLGRALIEAVYKAAAENGAASVYWHTQDTNKTARRLYDRVSELTPFLQYSKTLEDK
jgi:GNAT superfamily N-acetyltransferase